MLSRLGASLIFIFFFQSIFAEAKTIVHDPQQLMSLARSFLGNTSFQQAFHCGDAASIRAFVISCTGYQAGPNWSNDQCKYVADKNGFVVSRQVTNCSDDQVSFLVDATGDMSTLSSADFTQSHNNVADLFLDNLVDFTGYTRAEFTVESVTPTKYTFARQTTAPRIVDALTISGSLAEPGLKGFPIIITVVKDALGIGQVVRFRMSNETWFLVEDFSKGK
jgi:hypothetical protein